MQATSRWFYLVAALNRHPLLHGRASETRLRSRCAAAGQRRCSNRASDVSGWNSWPHRRHCLGSGSGRPARFGRLEHQIGGCLGAVVVSSVPQVVLPGPPSIMLKVALRKMCAEQPVAVLVAIVSIVNRGDHFAGGEQFPVTTARTTSGRRIGLCWSSSRCCSQCYPGGADSQCAECIHSKTPNRFHAGPSPAA
jgi:hypothetical protein